MSKKLTWRISLGVLSSSFYPLPGEPTLLCTIGGDSACSVHKARGDNKGQEADGGDWSVAHHPQERSERLCSQQNTVCLHKRVLEHVQGIILLITIQASSTDPAHVQVQTNFDDIFVTSRSIKLKLTSII